MPLRQVNQAYVIATSTTVDLSGVKLPEIDDSYFKRSKTNSSSEEEAFFSEKPKPAIVSDQRKGDQKAVDAGLLQAIAKVKIFAHFVSHLSVRSGLTYLLFNAQCSLFFALFPSHMCVIQVPLLKEYLNAKFSLSRGDRVHDMKF